MSVATRLVPIAAAMVLALGGCASQPAVPDGAASSVLKGAPTDAARWSGAAADAPRPTVEDRRWWARLGDDTIEAAVDRALTYNLDIATARTRLAEARAALRAAQGRRAPQIQGVTTLAATSTEQVAGRQLVPTLALQLDWDTDLWGGLAAGERAARADAQGRFEEVQAVRLSVAALTARSLIAWREARLDAAAQQGSLDLLRDTARVVRVRVDAGLAPRLDALRVDGEVAAAEAAVVAAVARAQDALRAVQVLIGDLHPGGPTAWLPPSAASGFGPLPTPPVHLPVDLLRERPDLRAAELVFRAALDRRAVAAAERLPSLRLPGLLTLGTAASGELLARLAASLTAQLAVPIADGGQRDAAKATADARIEAAELAWRRALQTALGQAESAFAGLANARQAISAQSAAVQSADAAEQQARLLYDNGLTGLLDLLDAQRSALVRRQALVRQQADAMRASVAVFEAMGLMAADESPPPG